MTIARVARAAGLTAAVAGAFVAVPTQMALAAPSATSNVGQDQAAGTNDAGIQFCREVTAIDVAVFSSSTGSNAVDILERGDQVDVVGSANGRYQVNYKEDGANRSGWITSSSNWIGACD